MSRNLKGRLTRLENQSESASNGLHPRFYDAICGAFPVDQLDDETRILVESLYGANPDVSDPFEELVNSEFK